MFVFVRSRAASTVVLLALAAGAWAPAAAKDALVVGTKEVAPFVYRDRAGAWRGISIELWSGIADRLDLDYELRELSLDEMIDGAASGELDAAVAALTITAEREQLVDFSHPYHSSGLGIAVSAERQAVWMRVVEAVVSPEFLRAVLALALVLLLVGVVVWLFERRRNAGQFGGTTMAGIGSGFWWSAVTMTTVGYGDKAPATLGGRLVALVWMFASLIVISGFTAAIASALTLAGLEGAVQGPQDLPHARVGSVAGTTSEAYLDRRGIGFLRFDDPAEALGELAAGRLDAVVYDKPVLQYLTRTEVGPRVRLLPHTLGLEQYAIALPPGSPIREAVNRALLEETGEFRWRETLVSHLGD